MNCNDKVQLKDRIMKNLLYVIAGLLIVIWGIAFWGLHAVGAIHFILAAAALIILIRLIFSRQLTPK
jgi:O-antigen/teichoic acid export membrane protein